MSSVQLKNFLNRPTVYLKEIKNLSIADIENIVEKSNINGGVLKAEIYETSNISIINGNDFTTVDFEFSNIEHDLYISGLFLPNFVKGSIEFFRVTSEKTSTSKRITKRYTTIHKDKILEMEYKETMSVLFPLKECVCLKTNKDEYFILRVNINVDDSLSLEIKTDDDKVSLRNFEDILEGIRFNLFYDFEDKITSLGKPKERYNGLIYGYEVEEIMKDLVSFKGSKYNNQDTMNIIIRGFQDKHSAIFQYKCLGSEVIKKSGKYEGELMTAFDKTHKYQIEHVDILKGFTISANSNNDVFYTCKLMVDQLCIATFDNKNFKRGYFDIDFIHNIPLFLAPYRTFFLTVTLNDINQDVSVEVAFKSLSLSDDVEIYSKMKGGFLISNHEPTTIMFEDDDCKFNFE